MSLEGDLKLPPRGPAKWGWTQRMMNKIATMRGVISPDESIVVTPRTGGLTLRRRQAAASAAPPFTVTNGSPYRIKGGSVFFNGADEITLEDTALFSNNGAFIAIHLPLELTPAGTALIPRHWEQLGMGTEIDFASPTSIVSVPTLAVTNLLYVLPGTRSTCDLYIPLAEIDSAGQLTQWWHAAAINVTLYRDHYTIGDL